MTRTITAASAATGFATLLKGWATTLTSRALPEGADDALSPRLAHDSGLSDCRPSAGEGRKPDPLAREMLRRSY